MTKFVSIVILLAASLASGCTSAPFTINTPSSIVPATTTPTLNMGGADFGLKIEDGKTIKVHNGPDAVEVKIDFAKGGEAYGSPVHVYAIFPVAVKQVFTTISDAKTGKQVRHEYGFYQPAGQTGFALTANTGVLLDYNTEYSYLVQGTDPITGDKYQHEGTFKTGAFAPQSIATGYYVTNLQVSASGPSKPTITGTMNRAAKLTLDFYTGGPGPTKLVKSVDLETYNNNGNSPDYFGFGLKDGDWGDLKLTGLISMNVKVDGKVVFNLNFSQP